MGIKASFDSIVHDMSEMTIHQIVEVLGNPGDISDIVEPRTGQQVRQYVWIGDDELKFITIRTDYEGTPVSCNLQGLPGLPITEILGIDQYIQRYLPGAVSPVGGIEGPDMPYEELRDAFELFLTVDGQEYDLDEDGDFAFNFGLTSPRGAEVQCTQLVILGDVGDDAHEIVVTLVSNLQIPEDSFWQVLDYMNRVNAMAGAARLAIEPDRMSPLVQMAICTGPRVANFIIGQSIREPRSAFESLLRALDSIILDGVSGRDAFAALVE